MATYQIASKTKKDLTYKVVIGLFMNYCECMAYSFSKNNDCKHIQEALKLRSAYNGGSADLKIENPEK